MISILIDFGSAEVKGYSPWRQSVDSTQLFLQRTLIIVDTLNKHERYKSLPQWQTH